MTIRCTRCLYDTTIPGITFDADGVCGYCHIHDQMDAAYPTGDEGWNALTAIAGDARRIGNVAYDVVVGLSGGCDSSMALWTAVKLGLRPLAVHFDNSWNTDTAERNMKAVTESLGVRLVRYRVNPHEFDQINRAFLLSGTRDFEAPTDIGLTTVLYHYAERHGIKYIFNGHSFRTEGIAPLGWSYMDGRYIADVCRQFGGPKRFDSFPNLWLKDFIRYGLLGIKRVRPLYYLDYNKEQAKRDLAQAFGWQWYGGHHKESEITSFFMALAYHRWNIDFRLLGWSALIRSGQMDRSAAAILLNDVPEYNSDILQRVERRTGVRLSEMLEAPKRTEADFATYKAAFRRLRPLFWLMWKRGAIPESFYRKYAAGVAK